MKSTPRNLNKLVASGSTVAIECKVLDEVKSIGDQLQNLAIKYEIIVITGSIPMRQLIEEVALCSIMARQ